MPSFHEKPHAMNIALYPTMFPSIAWWNYELLFISILCPDIILLELVFHFFLVTSSWLEGSSLMMSLHSSYYFSSWTVITFYLEQVSFFFSCRRLCMWYFLQVKCNCMVRAFHNEYSYWQILMHKYMIMQLIYSIQHSSISHREFSRCLPSLRGQHWDCALIQYVSKEVSFYI